MRETSNIFLQLCTGGDLFTYITGPMGAGNPLCEAEAKYVMYQLLEGLRYLHDLMISHRGESLFVWLMHNADLGQTSRNFRIVFFSSFV